MIIAGEIVGDLKQTILKDDRVKPDDIGYFFIILDYMGKVANFSLKLVAKLCRCGIDKARGIINRLEALGYFKHIVYRSKLGRFYSELIIQTPKIFRAVKKIVQAPKKIIKSIFVKKPKSSTVASTTKANKEATTTSANTCKSKEKQASISKSEYKRISEKIKKNVNFDYYVEHLNNSSGTKQVSDTKRIGEIINKANALINLMTEIATSDCPSYRVNGANVSSELVKERIMNIDYPTFKQVVETLHAQRNAPRNPRAYYITTLFNAPATAILSKEHDYMLDEFVADEEDKLAKKKRNLNSRFHFASERTEIDFEEIERRALREMYSNN